MPLRRYAVLLGKGLYDGLTLLIEWFVALTLAFMLYLAFAQVIARYFLNYPTPTYEELARLLMVVSTFIGGAVAVRRQSHITIRILENITKNVIVIRSLQCLATAIWLCFCVWFTYLAYGFFTWAQGVPFYFTVLKFPRLWVFYMSTFIGGILFSFYLSILLMNQLTELVRLQRSGQWKSP